VPSPVPAARRPGWQPRQRQVRRIGGRRTSPSGTAVANGTTGSCRCRVRAPASQPDAAESQAAASARLHCKATASFRVSCLRLIRGRSTAPRTGQAAASRIAYVRCRGWPVLVEAREIAIATRGAQLAHPLAVGVPGLGVIAAISAPSSATTCSRCRHSRSLPAGHGRRRRGGAACRTGSYRKANGQRARFGPCNYCQPPEPTGFCLDEDYRPNTTGLPTSGGHTRIQPPPGSHY